MSLCDVAGTGDDDDDDDELLVTVRYCGGEVLQRTVSARTGCRLCYDELDVSDRLDEFLPNEFAEMVYTCV